MKSSSNPVLDADRVSTPTAGAAAAATAAEKVTRVGEKAARNHPHLYDTYYDDLNLTGATPKVSLLEEDSAAYKAREKEMQRRVERARARRASLRSHQPSSLKPVKTITKQKGNQ